MKGFWNDREGLSITDVLSLSFAAAYFAVATVMVNHLRAGTLTRDAVDFFEVFTWPILVILGGYFTNGIVARLPSLRRRPPNLGTEPQDYETIGRDDRDSSPRI